MKHNRLAGLFKTIFIKETKPVMGDIKSSLEKAFKIAQIQKLQREIEAKKWDDQMKVIARKPKPLPKPRPQKRKVDDEAEKPKPKKQPKLDFFFKKKWEFTGLIFISVGFNSHNALLNEYVFISLCLWYMQIFKYQFKNSFWKVKKEGGVFSGGGLFSDMYWYPPLRILPPSKLEFFRNPLCLVTGKSKA